MEIITTVQQVARSKPCNVILLCSAAVRDLPFSEKCEHHIKAAPPRSALTDEDWGTLLLQRRRFESDYALFNDSRKLYNRKAECNVSIVRPLGYSTSHARPYTDASRPFFVPYRLS